MRCLALLSLIIALPAAVAQTDPPAEPPIERLLAHVPADAPLVFAVPSIEKLTNGLAAFGETIGVDSLADLKTATLLAQLDLLDDIEGLDTGGPLLIAQYPARPTPLLLCLLKDRDAWKRSAKAEDMDGDLLRVCVCGESGCAAVKGDVLIVGDDRDSVTAALKADGEFAGRFHARAGKLLDENHLVVYVIIPEWRPMIDAALMAIRVSFQMGMAMGSTHDEDAVALLDSQLDGFAKIVQQTEVFAVGVRGGARGISAAATASFKPDGSVAAYLKKVRATEAPLLRGLPAGDAMVALACEWAVPPGTPSLNTYWLKAALETDALKARLGQADHEKATNALLATYNDTTGYNLAMTPVPGDAGGMVMSAVYFTADPPALAENMRAAYAISAEFINPLGPGASMDVTSRQERIGSADVHAFDMVFRTEDEQIRRLMAAVYGESTTIYTAPRANDVMFVMGPTAIARTRFQTMFEGTGGSLQDDKRIAATSKLLSPNPQACLFIDAARSMTFLLDAVRATGQPVPAVDFGDAPMPFVACGVYLEPDRVRAELVIPAKPIKTIIDRIQSLSSEGEDY